MGMFDSLTFINCSDTLFKHCGVSFQTKDIDMNMSDYLIFNGRLWQAFDGATMTRHLDAQPYDFSGEVNIYGSYTDSFFEYWLEYNLTFKNGMLTTVVPVAEKVVKDLRDLSLKKPTPESKHAYVTINFNDAPREVYDHFHSKLKDHLDEIRRIVGDAKTEIVYQKIKDNRDLLSFPSPRMVRHHSVIQDVSDFEYSAPGQTSTTDH